MELPRGELLPAGAFAPAPDFILDVVGYAACGLDADDPDARVTRLGVQFGVVPTIGLETDAGTLVALVTDGPLDLFGEVDLSSSS